MTSPVGSYPITPTLVDPSGKLGNYTVSSTNGTLNVTAAALSVTASNASRAYGVTNPVFTGTITGIQNGDNITATYATTATVTSPVATLSDYPDPAGPQRQAGQLHRLQHQRHAERDGSGADRDGKQRFPGLRHHQSRVHRHHYRHPEQ